MISVQRALDVGRVAKTLLHETTFTCPQSLVYDNWDTVDAQRGKYLRQDVYASRTERLDGVFLINFSEPVKVYGRSFLSKVGKTWIREQVHPKLLANTSEISQETDGRKGEEHVYGEVLLIARWGIATWGHWLGELLPQVVLAEQSSPGRYRYALPQVVIDAPAGTSWAAIRESLVAYGVGADRWVGIKDYTDYIFPQLMVVTPIWSNFMIHPDAITLMREQIRHKSPVEKTARRKKVAFLRTESETRNITNVSEVASFFADLGFDLLEPGRLPFLQQVAIFQETETLVSVLGSSLTGLIYATPGVGVVSLAPSNFGDRFFYAMIQNRNGRYADVRGPVVATAAIEHWASFNLELNCLEAALHSVEDV